MKFLVTGGAGFIGSAVIRYILSDTDYKVLNYDKLTYAGNLNSIPSKLTSERYQFFHGDIGDEQQLKQALNSFQPDIIMHLAAESHVDRSIDTPIDFINTNFVGTYKLLEQARLYFENMSSQSKKLFRFHHVSTDEVYGDLPMPNESGNASLFTEDTPYSPSSPYSATKAGSDHLVRAWFRTYGLPTIVTNCSNNYGPYHFPEKLIPHVILSALKRNKIPVYGDGSQIRDWLYVEDHAKALVQVATKGTIGETYNIGGYNEKSNIEVVRTICDLLEEIRPSKNDNEKYSDLIEFVDDRPGHDRRYAIDATKIKNELGWVPKETFDSGLRKTVTWYIENREWWAQVISGEYQLSRVGISKRS